MRGTRYLRCPTCGHPIPWDGLCKTCQPMRLAAGIEKQRNSDGPPVPGNAERVERYAAMVAAGLRLFEPTPRERQRGAPGRAG